MSLLFIREVMDHYPAGGKEYALALAVADHADDEGVVVFDDEGKIMHKSRLTSKSYYWAVCAMYRRGWLHMIGHHTYRIPFLR